MTGMAMQSSAAPVSELGWAHASLSRNDRRRPTSGCSGARAAVTVLDIQHLSARPLNLIVRRLPPITVDDFDMKPMLFLLVLLAPTTAQPARLCPVMLADTPAQELERGHSPLADDILEQAGSEQLVRAALKTAFEMTLGTRRTPRVVYLIAAQMHEAWLPVIDGVRFVLVPDSEIASAHTSCAGLWSISTFTRKGDRISVGVRYGNVCSEHDCGFAVRTDDGTLAVGPGSGGLTVTTHCECNAMPPPN